MGTDHALAVRFLVCFVQHAYERSYSYRSALHAVLSFQYVHRHLKSKLRPVWDSLESLGYELEVRLIAAARLLAISAADRGIWHLGGE